MPRSDKTAFDLETLLKRLKIAAVESDAVKAVHAILEDTVADPALVIAGMPDFEDNDVILFEDDTVSIWHSRFLPGITVPAHDHQMSATIGIYRGSERNDLFENDPLGGIRKSSEVVLVAGDVFSIGPSAIHTVSCISDEPCCGIHVYLGNLTAVDRSLFDTEAGVTMCFTDENYHLLMRPDARNK